MFEYSNARNGRDRINGTLTFSFFTHSRRAVLTLPTTLFYFACFSLFILFFVLYFSLPLFFLFSLDCMRKWFFTDHRHDE
ncbi:hypothetical protein STCU_11441 [Strigomonas culicis]|uniref:Uncharacterized protein n=1 Tax=Strigomonas culicis TaxID=28005 RepID=S9TH68_9TRYP|nr:hypothetical protein STCU_11441 [Strigomonas culicis]|eukprot:EPY16269.1 hypothetical protein STCU_11441 [Strigomonas culicis]